MQSKLLLLAGVVAAAVFPSIVLARLARLTFHELRALRIDLLEVKRRMSVAVSYDVDADCGAPPAGRVFFGAGDPEGYGNQKNAYLSGGDILSWLLSGCLSDYVPMPAPRGASGQEKGGAS